MRYTNQFKRFNPLTGFVPYHPFYGHMNQLAVNVRRVLKGRTVAELHSAAKFIDGAIDCFIDDIRKEFKSNDEVSITRGDINDVDWFMRCRDRIDFAGNKKFPDGNYAHYCAVLAMWQLIDALELAGSIPHAHPNVEGSLSEAAEYVMQAMQSFSLGNEWKNEQEIAELVKQAIINRNKKAAQESHKKHREARKEAIKLFLEQYPTRSVQYAASKIAPAVDKAIRTVAKWLYEYKKQNT